MVGDVEFGLRRGKSKAGILPKRSAGDPAGGEDCASRFSRATDAATGSIEKVTSSHGADAKRALFMSDRRNSGRLTWSRALSLAHPKTRPVSAAQKLPRTCRTGPQYQNFPGLGIL